MTADFFIFGHFDQIPKNKKGMNLTLGRNFTGVVYEIWNWISNNKTFRLSVKPNALRELIEEIDEDGSGLLEFGEFCQLAAKFLVEEDEEALKKELKEAFRIYDKEGMY